METFEFKPFVRQNDFVSIPDSIFEALYGGAAGGGKSDILLFIPLIREWYKHPKFKGLFLRRTFPELEREVIRRATHWFPLTGARYDADKKSWKWPSGAFFDFGHAEHESDIKKYDTAEYNYIAFDELTSFTEYQYLYLAASRCRSSTNELPAIVRSGSNPDGVGHAWVKRRFVQPAKTGYTIIFDKVSTSKRIFIPAKATDNPYLQSADPEYTNRLQLLPEKEKLAKLYGSWDIISGTAFDEFRRIHMPDEPTNAIHICAPFDIPKYWQKIAAMDWGWSAQNVILKGSLSPENRFYVTNRRAWKEEYITNIGIEASELCKDVQFFFLCRSAWQHDPGKVLTIAEQFEQASGIKPFPADNDRVSGKILINEFLRWTQKKKIFREVKDFDAEFAAKVLRIGGIDKYNDYFNSFKQDQDEANLPKLQIFNTEELEPLIDIFPQCLIDEKNIEDVAEFSGDDDYDALRYLLKGTIYLKSHIDPIAQAKEKLTAEFNEGKIEINSYYRRMECLERKTSSPVRVRM